ncbi:DUF6299 family protein [Streptomyces sp. NPDC051219]|uniref:DUF6299 family protein n=1 Tax=Streptomyces sp. NPDC051219 TaxID=3155283 RepID=UPI0034173DD5
MATAFPVATEAAEPVNSVSVQEYGQIAADGLVTLSGTYRCIDEAESGSVFIATNITQNGTSSQSIGGTEAVCDGLEHPWTNSGRPSTQPTDVAAFAAGPAQVEVRMLTFRTAGGWLPLPHFLVDQESPVTLVSTP